jgi:predicted RNA-binding Zn-ribbon protein involved in translation (DUF1610 family)
MIVLQNWIKNYWVNNEGETMTKGLCPECGKKVIIQKRKAVNGKEYTVYYDCFLNGISSHSFTCEGKKQRDAVMNRIRECFVNPEYKNINIYNIDFVVMWKYNNNPDLRH